MFTTKIILIMVLAAIHIFTNGVFCAPLFNIDNWEGDLRGGNLLEQFLIIVLGFVLLFLSAEVKLGIWIYERWRKGRTI